MNPGLTATLPHPGDADAGTLFASLYDELRRLARREVRRNGGRDLMSTNTLVHEAWLNMGQRTSLSFAEHDLPVHTNTCR